MSNSTAPFRIWIAGSNEWLPGPQFATLDVALANAHKLATTGEVAIELPTRHWHTFQNGEQYLGPKHLARIQLARGSQTDLSTRANAVIAGTPVDEEINRAYQLSIGKTRATSRASTSPGATSRRISSTHISTPRTIESSTREASVPNVRRSRPQSIAPAHERRDSKRYDAKEVLKDPACAIQTRRTEILDLSETGFRISIPAGVKVTPAGRVVLVFSGRHGFFELSTKTCWMHDGEAGLRVEKGGSNLVGQMFVRKMISKWIEQEAKRKKNRRH